MDILAEPILFFGLCVLVLSIGNAVTIWSLWWFMKMNRKAHEEVCRAFDRGLATAREIANDSFSLRVANEILAEDRKENTL